MLSLPAIAAVLPAVRQSAIVTLPVAATEVWYTIQHTTGTDRVCNMSQPDSYSLFTPLTWTRQNWLVLSACVGSMNKLLKCMPTQCALFTALVGQCCCCCLTVRVSEQWCGRGSHLVHRAHQECQIAVSWGRTEARCWIIWLTVSSAWECCPEPDWSHTECAARSLTTLWDLDLATILARLADRSEP